MSISIDEVKHIAFLARLSLTEEEAERYSNDLSRILEYASTICKLDTADVPTTSHVIEIKNVLRDDETGNTLDRETVLSQAPSSDDACFIAPRIL
ncbi:MAG: Asp-tRNA(Asn)/Glu-tRNA(Gln) amidotransferase GatCAB subunit C [Candidatus Hydrogenedentes bacterium CG07_land_8_20_14_0_80_42_17]|nr:MAG: asparaginyl/glutamyl-tRNA amidotransferase subunit C [Candidatus Hydrogenedentes bacterium CG1_02_42_14]PIU48534.1 MAG: Asp-tRNA(Asn)/Glu-tRNA(Gln) amidotransferase GatCAB subunit C [Candidatus Hydrogenedentes bacterium CG07_land_8_20_14_0_80_42_17]